MVEVSLKLAAASTPLLKLAAAIPAIYGSSLLLQVSFTNEILHFFLEVQSFYITFLSYFLEFSILP